MGKFNISHITKEMQRQVDEQPNLVVEEQGTVLSVEDGIVRASGLSQAMLSEIVEFKNGERGMILNLERDQVGIVMLNQYNLIKEGDPVFRTNQIFKIPVGDQFLGRVVNANGEPIDGKGSIQPDGELPVEKIAPGVMTRQSVDQPLVTGILSIDAMFPIGRGQRELIIGDRQTGKTTVATDTIINQKGGDVLCVYVAIGQKNSSIAALVANLEEQGAMDYTVVVSAPAAELPALQYIAPYAGCTLAEYWLSKGRDVLIIYDDLSKHAIAYRTLSLLLRRPPGREAYPGDVFYLHSRLLERACRLNKENGGGSITALPIIETQAGDISAYIPTNVISITDGQIFMMTSLFNSGQRPAIDAGLSVSRVGGAAQIKSVKQMGASMKLELANFRELDSFSQFGSELDKVSKYTLAHGRRILQLLKQAPNHPYKQTDEAIILFAIKEKFIDLVPTDRMIEYRHFFLKKFREDPYRALWFDLRTKKAFEKERNMLAYRYAFKQITKEFLDQIGYQPDDEEKDTFEKILQPVEEEKKIFDDIRREFLESDNANLNPDVEEEVVKTKRQKLQIPEIPLEALEEHRKQKEAEAAKSSERADAHSGSEEQASDGEEAAEHDAGNELVQEYVDEWKLKRYQKYVDVDHLEAEDFTFGDLSNKEESLGQGISIAGKPEQIDYGKITSLNEKINQPKKLVAPNYLRIKRVKDPKIAIVNLDLQEFENFVDGRTALFVENDLHWSDVKTVVVYIDNDLQTVIGQWNVHTEMDQSWSDDAINSQELSGHLTKIIIDSFAQYSENGILSQYGIYDNNFRSLWLKYHE